RNVLLIGNTGNGKSTLANVLTNRREVRREKVTKELVESGDKCYKCQRKFVEGNNVNNAEEKDKKIIEAFIEGKGPYLFHEECFNFKESGDAVSETKSIQIEEFEVSGIRYRIIDT